MALTALHDLPAPAKLTLFLHRNPNYVARSEPPDETTHGASAPSRSSRSRDLEMLRM